MKFLIGFTIFLFSSSNCICWFGAEANPIDLINLKAGEEDFCYNDSLSCGPSNWGGYCNTGNKQSPINLKVTMKDIIRTQITKPYYKLILSKAYMKDFSNYFIKNNGHSVTITLDEDDSNKLRISYNSLNRKEYYTFANMHFHWGSTSAKGSEHLVDDASYPIEIHMVHWSSKYESIQEAVEAVNDPNALSVLGTFAHICKKYEKSPFASIISSVEDVGSNPNNLTHVDNTKFSLKGFIPKFLKHFSYDGSLTTPGCTQIVKWTVFANTVCITEDELEVFRNVQTPDGSLLDKNYRPIQPLGNRVIDFHL